MPSQTQPRFRLLTVCGSLQARSANRAAIAVASAVATRAGATVDHYDRLADIPAFNADRDDEQIEAVEDWRRRVDAADAVLVAAPEYAGGVAGVVKNTFDWLVGSGNMYRKPVGVIAVGTSGGWHARQAVAQTLTWQGAYVVAELGIAAPRTKSDEEGRLTDVATVTAIAALTELLLGVTTMPADRPRRCCRPGRRLARHRLLASSLLCERIPVVSGAPDRDGASPRVFIPSG